MVLDKQGVIDFLHEQGVSFELVEHPAMFTIEELEDSGLFPTGLVAKNLFLRNAQGNRHFLVVLEGAKTVDLRALRGVLGTSRLSFASEERLMKYLGLEKGSVTPFGVLNDEARVVDVYFDRDLADCMVGFHPNRNTATVILPCKKVVELIQAHGNHFDYIDLPCQEEQ